MSRPDLPPSEDLKRAAFDFLRLAYVQRADARQKAMGLQYTEAETHDLANTVVAMFSGWMAGHVRVPVHVLEEMRNDLSLHGAGDTEAAHKIDELLEGARL